MRGNAFIQKILTPDDIISKLKPFQGTLDEERLNEKFERLHSTADKLRRKSSDFDIGFAHTLSSFVVDSYVTSVIKEFGSQLKWFSKTYNINNQQDFFASYFLMPESEVQKKMSLDNTAIGKADSVLGKSLKFAIVDSNEVQRMDGKGAFIIRKLLKAYLTNPQQLPNDYINYIIKTELRRNLSKDKYDQIIKTIRIELGFKPNVLIWKDYECRNALRYLMVNHLELVKSSLSRVIFDYVSNMTDTFAMSDYAELY